MRMRSARGEETRRRIISAACELLHKQGFVATSPEQIMEASRTGKGQFYHYFKSKEDFIHQVLQDRLEAIKSGARSFNREITSWEALEKWFLTHIELQRAFGMTRGCPFGTIGNEVTETDELIRQDINLIFEVIKNNVAAFFIKEKAAGRLAKEAHEDRLADFCIATLQGAMLMGKIRRSSQTGEDTIREALAHLRRYVVTPGSATRRGTARPRGRVRRR